MPHMAIPRVVIIGGGFGGLYAAKALRRAPVEVVLLDRRNYHLFQPLLYQVATAALNAADIAEPIRRVLRRHKNTRVLLAEATSVDVDRRCVNLVDGTISYDYVIVATGATHSYFGHDEYARVAPGLKSIEDALEMRRRVLLGYEAAERTPDPAVRRACLTFVVVGGGPTGVELAGALAEIARHSLKDDFRAIDPSEAKVVLVEGLPRVLTAFPEELSAKARTQLERLGVDVRTKTMVTNVDAHGVTLRHDQGEKRLAARTVLWAAGVSASPLAKSLGAPLDKAGRVQVNRDLTIPGHPEVFVIGDLAILEQDGKPVTGLAAVAAQEGPHAAKNVLRAIEGQPLEPFHYLDKGTLATIGRAAAVAHFGRVKLSGLVAWLMWLFVHIFLLIGFRNRFLVMFSWAWTYLTFDRGARLITGDVGPVVSGAEMEPDCRDDGAATPPPQPAARAG
jgi:NADH:ubiquinone reductase (H+-translocating)